MPSVFSDVTSIQIRLTRDDVEENDDRIVIRYKNEGMYQLFFQDGSMNSQVVCSTVLSASELETYLESFFTLLSFDRDPFMTVEFQIPCLSCIQFYPKDFQNHTLRHTLKSLMPLLHSVFRYT